MTRLDHDWLDRFHHLAADGGEQPPASKLAMLVRPAIVARPGRMLVWCDWSAIEARVLPWLANSEGGEAMLDVFRTNDADPSLPDVYRISAGKLLGKDPREVTSEERQSHGKLPVLSLGYLGGIGALQNMANNYRVYLDDTTAQWMVDTWRAENPWARAFGDAVWGAITDAMESPGSAMEAGRAVCIFDRSYLGGSLFCFLPCGRPLCYPAIRWEKNEVVDKTTGKVEMRWQLTFRRPHGRSVIWRGRCLAGDTLVGTDRGWVRLDQVKASDLLWDGVAWVRHDGLLFQGVKATMPVDGVRMTPDHRVLSTGGWVEAKDFARSDRAAVRLPDSLVAGRDEGPRGVVVLAGAVRLRGRKGGVFGGLEALDQTATASVVRVQDARDTGQSLLDARHDAASGLRRVALDERPLPPADAPGVAQLRRARHRGMRAVAGVVRSLLGRHGADLCAGADAGAARQRAGVFTGELPVGHPHGAGPQPAAQPAVQREGSVEGDSHPDEHPALSMASEHVYDLANAGPRTRFVVLGDDGPLIVHNCLENLTQAAAASLLRWTAVALDLEDDWLPTVGHTHDEIVTEPREEEADDAARILHEYFVGGFPWTEGLPLAAESTISLYYSKSKIVA